MTSEIKSQKLENGLTVIGEFQKHVRSTAIGYFVQTGSRDEIGNESGVSHFLEHMMFKGTKKRSALDITYELGNLGAQANAFTSEENTVYYAAVLPEYFSKMQELLSDMLRPALVKDDFDTEKNVILEEIALYQDRPQFYLFEHAHKDYFGTHSAGNSVLGSTESITDLTRDEMQSYFDRRYVPSRMVLVATGMFDWNKFIDDAQKLTTNWLKQDASREVKPCSPKALFREYKKKNVTQAHVLFMTEGASAQDEERYPISVLALILGDVQGSRLYWELVDCGLAETAVSDNDERDGTGVFYGYAATEPERVDEVSSRMKSVLSAPLSFSQNDLARAKNKLISKIVLGGELPMGRLMAIGLEWNYRRCLEPLKEVIEKVRQVTIEDIEQALKKYPLSKWAEFRLLPG